MAAEVRVLNRARYSIMVETGRLSSYETTKVSESWYHPRQGQEQCVSVQRWAEKVLRWESARLQAECKRAGLSYEGDPPDLRRRLFDHVGRDYDDEVVADTGREPDTDTDTDDTPEGDDSPDYQEILEWEYGDKLSAVADLREASIPNDWGTEELNEWLREKAGS